MVIRSIQHGFTLVEIAVVLVVVGLLLGGFIGSFTDRIETTRRANTMKQLEEIKSALIGFASAMGRLPCPASATSNGEEDVPGTSCANVNSFVPGKTLGLSGPYNRDNLVIDSWSNPIRYSVTDSNSSAFTRSGEMKNVGMAALSPDLIMCRSYTAVTACSSASETLTNSTPFIILSLGKDGSDFVGGLSPDNNQGENASEAIVTANAAGEDIAYTVANDRVFVSASYNSIDGSAAKFDDLILWVSPYVLYSTMIEAGQLP